MNFKKYKEKKGKNLNSISKANSSDADRFVLMENQYDVDTGKKLESATFNLSLSDMKGRRDAAQEEADNLTQLIDDLEAL